MPLIIYTVTSCKCCFIAISYGLILLLGFWLCFALTAADPHLQ